MSRFDYALARTLGYEGRYSNHPADSGGPTMFGITEDTFRAWAIANKVENAASVENITLSLAKEIYLQVYWDSIRLDELDSKHVAAELFDTAVNCGHRTAVKMAQRAANFLCPDSSEPLLADGMLGPVTLNALNRLSERYENPLLRAMNGEQYIHYRDLVERRPKDRAFSRGWMKRLEVFGGSDDD